MSDRLSRQEIKRDEFVEALERSASFMERNTRALIIGAVALLVALAAAFGTYWWMEAREAKAAEALSEALEVSRAPVGQDAAPADWDGPVFADVAERRARSRELFTALQEEYSGSDAADVAIVYLAQIAAEEGDPERARNLWHSFLEEHDDHVLSGQVRVNLIHLDREQGRGEELVQELENLLTMTPEDRFLPGDVVLWELARTYEEMGRSDEAQDTYRRLTEEYPTSAYAAPARQKLPGAGGGPGVPGGAIPFQVG